jgi:hypothetical protein
MTGGYKMPLDPRPLLIRLETEQDASVVWKELWNELHHQGDIGDASFAAVPHLVRICRKRGVFDWNTYAIVAVIELARNVGANPDVPLWLKDEYFQSIHELAEIGAVEVLHANTVEDVRAILSVIAIERGLRKHGEFLLKYSEDELADFEPKS